MSIFLTVGLIKKRFRFIKLDLSNYANKADLKNATGADTMKFAKKVELASLKSELIN